MNRWWYGNIIRTIIPGKANSLHHTNRATAIYKDYTQPTTKHTNEQATTKDQKRCLVGCLSRTISISMRVFVYVVPFSGEMEDDGQYNCKKSRRKKAYSYTLCFTISLDRTLSTRYCTELNRILLEYKVLTEDYLTTIRATHCS